MPKLFNQVAAVVAILSLSACGWHLRGAMQDFPPGSQLYIIAEDPHSDIAEHLSRLLQSSSLPLVDSAAEADYSLRIHKEIERKHTLSVNAKGRVSEYELVTGAVYSVQDKNGRTLLDHAETDIYRTLTWNDREVVSKGEEERLLRSEMRRELIARIIDRLRRINVQAAETDNSH